MRKKISALCMAVILALNIGNVAHATTVYADPEAYYYEHPDEHPANVPLATDQSVDSGTYRSLTTTERTKKGALKTKSDYINKTYTHNKRYDGMLIHDGIDVSYHNGTINWEKVKADGVDYAFIRVGYRGYGKAGTLCNDVKFVENIEGAIAAGINVGVYFFTEALNTTEAKEEAEFCIQKLEPYREHITMPVVIDYEYPPIGNGYTGGRMYDAKLSKTAATKNVKKFCKTIAEANYTPMIYANGNDLQKLINGATLEKNYKIWLANYTTKTTYTGLYEYWQYTSNGKVSGISGKVDCNFWYTTEEISDLNKTSLEGAVFSKVSPLTYTGNLRKPAVTLTLGDKTLVENTDYTLTYLNNREAGLATITASGIGTYKDEVSTTFIIKPKKLTSFRRKSGTKSIKLAWNKGDSITGYKIYRKDTFLSTKYTLVKTINNPENTVWYDNELEHDREYYYAIRTYKTVNGNTYYSNYRYLTAATLPGGTTVTMRTKKKLFSQPDSTQPTLLTIPKNAIVTYIGKTYIDDKNTMFHVKYTANDQTYSGYIISSNCLIYQ